MDRKCNTCRRVKTPTLKMYNSVKSMNPSCLSNRRAYKKSRNINIVSNNILIPLLIPMKKNLQAQPYSEIVKSDVDAAQFRIRKALLHIKDLVSYKK